MMSSKRQVPNVTETDIDLAERRLKVRFDSARRQVLQSNDSFDILACPGSGKTTLLVAKLSMLAEKWSAVSRGICVLSHTNVARREIETRLGGTPAGDRLLRYPHFVGTIHAFVNEFLALPWLRSCSQEVRIVDDEFCFAWLKRHLLRWSSRRRLGSLAYKERTLNGHIRSLVCGEAITTLNAPDGINDSEWNALREAKAQSLTQGIFYHADMFAAAERLLDHCSEVPEMLRTRFPVVFMDEMQDTSETQNILLHRVFPPSGTVLRQRFGDSNQAIYDYGQSRATTDSFPGPKVQSIPNSKRFGPWIAARAEPLAPVPPHPSLVGEGPQANSWAVLEDDSQIPHTIFLFRPESAKSVLPGFGELLLSVFPDSVLQSVGFLARAIGRVGKSQAGDDKQPRSLTDYWVGYEPRSTRLDPRPSTLPDYVHLAQRQRAKQTDCGESVKTVAKGIVELVQAVIPGPLLSGIRPISWLRESLNGEADAQRLMDELIWQWCVETVPLAEDAWPVHLAQIRKALCPVIGDQWNTSADEFCQWSQEFADERGGDGGTAATPPNIFRFARGNRSVNVDVGTIHSAKGQTHTATLVVETFFKEHDLSDLMDWLTAKKRGWAGKNAIERPERMRLVYTAVTRPTHLLCLAVRRNSFGTVLEKDPSVCALRDQGWIIREL